MNILVLLPNPEHSADRVQNFSYVQVASDLCYVLEAQVGMCSFHLLVARRSMQRA